MSTLNAAGLVGRALPFGIAAALAVGCGSSHGTPNGNGTATSPASGAAASPAGPATPVPTVSGGSPGTGAMACVDWPGGAAHAALPSSFVPVSAERCVSGATTVPGKGLWTTATLQRTTGDLSSLVSALRQPTAARQPGTMCPAIAVVPPQLALVDASGQTLIPKIPDGDCGQPSDQVMSALNSLRWQAVSVRLIAPVPGANATPTTTVTPGGPMQTSSAKTTVTPGGPMQTSSATASASAGGGADPGGPMQSTSPSPNPNPGGPMRPTSGAG